MKKITLLFSLVLLFSLTTFAVDKPVKIGVIGLTHGHVHGLFRDKENKDIEIVAVVESNVALAHKYAEKYGYSKDIIYTTIHQMLAEIQPEAVLGFGNIYDHLSIVEACAPLGIDVMVEKPLAVNMEHAKKIHDLAIKYDIDVLTNYETTWYPSNEKAYELIHEDKIGEVRKVVINDGHKGPKNIHVEEEFLEWLTDEKLNGGGAIIDFGCYGANLLTWLFDGEKPVAITAITAQYQPENNPNVDDESIILVEYKSKVGVIQGSWNWPIGRKDMEVFGLKGVIDAPNPQEVTMKISKNYSDYDQTNYNMKDRAYPFNNPFSMFAHVVRKEIKLPNYSPSTLENNMIVVEILEKAKKSAKKGKKITL
ncbi:Gfo/Idh/MocA family protein [Flammeovirga kamogawensis]|uniref:Gfo/Idh/MocA family oxidoreductase n=1 Tax=Flammeovirga kamogawensis TaxID=373891 RepID=A0ABX8H3Y4_9BACT|nr:Gfo/Idh/MocA family oxidoreductase [Flammeovirga kamogawensis]MBB6460471.1 putative dehydrogenase [Flammeovirga kamogawensis]QWG10277.1 Gfo/Idh/MocA family oxidoreductase [Flammeovirga kamogawensis]TRX64725.1 Gfo/Idh/MocA family oxidoreductase [Flammeovirga kamogawensis]